MAQDEYLYILAAASKKVITWRWLQANSPTKYNWTAIINEIHCMGKCINIKYYDAYVNTIFFLKITFGMHNSGGNYSQTVKRDRGV